MHDNKLHGTPGPSPASWDLKDTRCTIVTRQMIVDKAREYLGTPFHHQARLKFVGVDCIGLLRCVADELYPPDQLSQHDCPDYERIPKGTKILDELGEVLERIPKSKVGIGDVLIFWTDPATKFPQHAAITTDIGIIHTWERAGKVVENSLEGIWEDRVLCAFTFPTSD